MRLKTVRLRCSAMTMSVRRLRMRMTSAASTATAVPAPMAMPMSACASDGASLMPSPTMATMPCLSCSSRMVACLSPGRQSACTLATSMPRRSATSLATDPLSPVHMYTATPARWSAAMVRGASSLTVSEMPRTPSTPTISCPTSTAVMPRVRRLSALALTASGTIRPERSMSSSLPAQSAAPSHVRTPTTPMPTSARKLPGTRTAPSAAPVMSSCCARAPARMACAMGCSEGHSTAAAALRSSCRAASTAFGCRWGLPSGCSSSGVEWNSDTTGLPVVSVPVLSSTMAPRADMRSSASPPLMSTPLRAETPVPTMTAVGVARPSVHGQAMTTTEMPKSSAKRKGSSWSSAIHSAGMAPV
mmetsp:Transcript_1433/g.3718  ORF Transcript_1433/g.3718 Transcript_1433/m.3718 type:complete len:360 (-) Transcript_1433:1784-2863(-)